MGGSRRRKARFRPKLSIRPRKKRVTKSRVPSEIQSGSMDMARKLGAQAIWDDQRRMSNNYSANGLLSDCNGGFGRNLDHRAEALTDKAAAIGADLQQPDDSDDDIRQAEGKHRKDGQRALPMKPSTHQQQIIKRLLEAHGDDLEAMVKDHRLNPMLLPASKLRKLVEGYAAFGTGGRCRFRVPIKHL